MDSNQSVIFWKGLILLCHISWLQDIFFIRMSCHNGYNDMVFPQRVSFNVYHDYPFIRMTGMIRGLCSGYNLLANIIFLAWGILIKNVFKYLTILDSLPCVLLEWERGGGGVFFFTFFISIRVLSDDLSNIHLFN